MIDYNGIIVTPSIKSNFRLIRSKNEIFSKGKVICEIKDDCLYFRLPDFDEDDTICVISQKNGWFKCLIQCDIPFGEYCFEDDSNEDVKIIYYGDN